MYPRDVALDMAIDALGVGRVAAHLAADDHEIVRAAEVFDAYLRALEGHRDIESARD